MQKIVKFNRAFLYCCMVVMFCLHPLFTRSEPLQGKPLTISIKNTSLAEVLRQVSKKSGLYIYFQDADLASYSSVSIDVKNKPVDVVLHELLDGRGLTWVEVDKNSIAIRKKEVVSYNENYSDTMVIVSGKVIDGNGSPIPGATVLVKGTKIGTTANVNGIFNLKDVPGNAMLTISSISFVSRDIPVRNRGDIGIAELRKLVKQLDETVILAYTKTTGRKLTGNVSGIKAKDIQYSPVNNPILAVAGRVPGVTITQASGFAGSGVEIIIQGLNSLNKGNVPFYVVDGVPYVQTLLPNLASVLKPSGDRGAGDGPTNGNPLSYINTSDIESIEILKDADATAIYGSRAANGAIIITTKRGKAGKMKIDVNYQMGFGKVARKLKLLNTNQYLTMRKEAKYNDNATIRPSDYDINGTWDSTKNTDWQKELIGNTAKFCDVQLGLSGGSPNVNYIIGTNYHRETTVLRTEIANKRAGLRFSIGAVSNNQKLKVDLSASYMSDESNLPTTDLTLDAMTLAPNMPDLYTTNGDINWAPTNTGVSSIRSNPIAVLSSLYHNKTRNLIASSAATYVISQGLEIKTSFGYTSLITDELMTEPLSQFRPEIRPFIERTADYGFNDINSWIIEPQMLYKKSIARGELNFLIGGTFQEKNSTRNQLSGTGYATDQVLENRNAAKSVSVPSNSTIISSYKYNAAFFQLNYDWQDKYIINLSGRRDGSSRFGPQNRFHNFGAVGAAWIFSNESIIKEKLPFISYGKLRASYGNTGNDQIGDYAYFSLYQNTGSDIPYRGSTALEPVRLTNPYLQWEETRKLSMGLDLGFWNDRILLSSIYYRNTSSNMLVGALLPTTVGPGGLTINLPAKIVNYGIELTLNTENITTNGFSWNSNINLTIPTNKLSSFPGLENSGYANTYVIGEPVNNIKTYRSKGVNPTTGIYEFLDYEGKVTTDPGSDRRNYTNIINQNPKYYGGLNNTLTYKRIALDFLFQFVKQVGKNMPFTAPPGYTINNQTVSVLDRWQKEGDNKLYQKYTTNNPNLRNAFANQLIGSDAYWEDASYIRLKNISLSYSFKGDILSVTRIQALNIYISSQNLLTFTSYEGLDPETRSNFSLPPLRVITIGIRATL